MQKTTNNTPSSVEIEKQVLGVMLIKKTACAPIMSLLKKEHFYATKNAEIFETCNKLFLAGKNIDLQSVVSKCAVSSSYIASLTSTSFCLLSDIGDKCETIKDAYKRRELTNKAKLLISELQGKEELNYITSQFNESYYSIMADEAEGSTRLSDTVKEVVPEIINRTYDNISGFSTGLTDLDKLTRLEPTDLVVIAARPSMGKTALALNIATHVSKGSGVLFYSLEMSKSQLAKRAIAQASRVSGSVIFKGLPNKIDREKLKNSVDKLSKLNLYVDDTEQLSISQIRARATMEMAKHDICCIVVDYIGLAKGYGENRTLEVSSISSGLKAMAKKMNVPVIALSQLNRGVEQRTDKRPMLSDLRESGSIEQDADVIIFPYRDEVYNKNEDNPNRGIAEIIIGKCRNGATGTAMVGFNGELIEFYNLTFDSEC